MTLAKDMCLLAKRSWYGMRDAGQAFEFAVRDNFAQKELVQGLFSPCVFRHSLRRLWYFVHGDDYVGIVAQSDADWYLQRVQQVHHQSKECVAVWRSSGYENPDSHDLSLPLPCVMKM